MSVDAGREAEAIKRLTSRTVEGTRLAKWKLDSIFRPHRKLFYLQNQRRTTNQRVSYGLTCSS